MIVICLTMFLTYWGKEMGSEARGFFSFALVLTLIIGIPTLSLIILLAKRHKPNVTPQSDKVDN